MGIDALFGAFRNAGNLKGIFKPELFEGFGEKIKLAFDGVKHVEGNIAVHLSEADMGKQYASVFQEIRNKFTLGNSPLEFTGRLKSTGQKGHFTISGSLHNLEHELSALTIKVNNVGKKPVINLTSGSLGSKSNIVLDFNKNLLPIEEATVSETLSKGVSKINANFGGLQVRASSDVNQMKGIPLIEEKLNQIGAGIQSFWKSAFETKAEKSAIRGAEYTQRGVLTRQARAHKQYILQLLKNKYEIPEQVLQNAELEYFNDIHKAAEGILNKTKIPPQLVEKMKNDTKFFDDVIDYVNAARADEILHSDLKNLGFNVG